MSEGLIIDDNRQTADALQQMLKILDLSARIAYGSSPAMVVLGSFTFLLFQSPKTNSRASGLPPTPPFVIPTIFRIQK